jgi:hypothetical protein
MERIMSNKRLRKKKEKQQRQPGEAGGGSPQAASSAASPRSSTPEDDARLGSFFAELGTSLWRARQNMVDPATKEPLAEMRRPYRHLDRAWDALATQQVEVHDLTGRRFDSGMALKVIAFQPTPDVTEETIMETIKPTVYFRNRQVQMGEVIVATPETASTST